MTPEEPEDKYSTKPVFPAEATAAGKKVASSVTLPNAFGRYRVTRLLGQGGYGRVYQAFDEQLQRDVAIKVTSGQRWTGTAQATMLAEARILAGLDHPHIVPVYDVGQTEQQELFVVSKLIDGADLATRLKLNRPDRLLALQIVEAIAEALDYAHARGLVHRDVKPANILLDRQDRPFLADFGVALQESAFGKPDDSLGTPAYMSPEQARGEGHRVDNRSDIYSLGVVLYELLTGRPPFRAENMLELMGLVASEEVRTPRLFETTISPELERICLKALARRASDRYAVARDLADEIRWLLAHQAPTPGHLPAAVFTGSSQTPLTPSATLTPVELPSEGLEAGQPSGPIRVVPKGLRSFDAADASFFLELLPGPFDREGLPDSLRFWKTRIEQTDSERTFAVGVLYGPSGCGKSSLVKAGLLPRLAPQVVAIYLEASGEDFEGRLLRAVRKAIPDAEGETLAEALATIRRRRLVPSGGKLLLVLDQFEQWLFAQSTYKSTALTNALKQCDGGMVQTLLLVRDDFWLSLSRLLRELEVTMDGENSLLVDLFDLDHAARVLGLFGRALGKLPESSKDWNEEQQKFVRTAVEGLAENQKVISVRLAVFAEMMKSRKWTLESLRAVGGIEGVGVTFLEETFGARHAPLHHRQHDKAVRGLLAALLPASGTDIKGAMRSAAELQAAAGYDRQPQEFAELLGILDKNLRLITPVDLEERDRDCSTIVPNRGEVQGDQAMPGDSTSRANSPRASEQLGQLLYYQLADDYLVPSLREWLTRKQRETKKGRAELKLAERTAAWSAVKETKQLPTLGEWLRIRSLTDRAKWKPAERLLMRAADRMQLTRLALAGAACAVLLVAGISTWRAIDSQRRDQAASGQVEKLQAAEFAGVPSAVAELTPYRALANPKLTAALEQAAAESPERLKLSLGLLGHDPAALEYVAGQLPRAEAEQVPVLVALLEPYKQELLPRFWEQALGAASQESASRGGDSQALLPLASALAAYDPQSEQWPSIAAAVAERLVRENALRVPTWIKTLRPVAAPLRGPLEAIYRDAAQDSQIRLLAADTLGDYLSADPAGLFELLADGSERQFVALVERLAGHRDEAVRLAGAEVVKPLNPLAEENEKEKLALRQANAGALLLRLGAAEGVWPLLRHSPDPRVRSYLIHALVARGVAPAGLMERYRSEGEVSARRALLLCLGEYPLEQFAAAERTEFLERLKRDFRDDPDPGLHGAAEWLLRQWGETAWLKQAREELVQGKKGQSGANEAGAHAPRWYLNSQGQTYAIIDAGEFRMGSPEREAGRQSDETQHSRRIGRRFAMATTEVTRAQWRKFYQETKNVTDPDVSGLERFSPTDDCPMVGISWYDAAAYCNWLSKQEGIPEEQWCYEPLGESGEMRAKRNFWELSGYRLPTESEWEYSCRSGAETPYSYGGTPGLLGKYAWYNQNSGECSYEVGTLKPNDLGLFDLQGNVWEWCFDQYGPYPRGDKSSVADKPSVVVSQADRVLRGGAFVSRAGDARASDRNHDRPVVGLFNDGFRPSRTYR